MALVTRGNNMRLLRGGKVRALIMPGRPRNVDDTDPLEAAIRSLFAAGEQGAWYDPSDFSTMFQDSNGATPVIAIEQPVGLIFDKSKGLVPGPQLVANGDFSSGTTGWTSNLSTLAAVNGELVLTGDAGANFSGARYSFPTVVGTCYKVTGQFRRGTSANSAGVVIKATNNITSISLNSTTTTAVFSIFFIAPATTATIDCFESGASAGGTVIFDNISAQSLSGNHAFQSTTTSRPILRNRYNLLVQTATLSTQNVTTRATSHKLSFSGAGTITLSGTATGTFSAGTNTFTATAGTLTLTVSGTVTEAMLTEANDGNVPYQWVTTGAQSTSNPVSTVTAGYDTDVTKFPPYLFFDGTDDWLSTANIDFSATDKMSVFAGVRKLSDSQQRIIAELSATIASNNGAFMLSAPNSAAANYNFSSKGTSQVDNTVTTYAAPITNVVTGLADISGPNNTIRINGAATPLTTSQGTGSYGAAYPLYIGRRFNTAATSFSGRLYSLIVRGALTSSPQLEQTEQWVATKTGVTL